MERGEAGERGAKTVERRHGAPGRGLVWTVAAVMLVTAACAGSPRGKPKMGDDVAATAPAEAPGAAAVAEPFAAAPAGSGDAGNGGTGADRRRASVPPASALSAGPGVAGPDVAGPGVAGPGAEGPLAAGSLPGSAWTRASTLVVWPSRDGHATVVHDGRLWVLGGWGAGPRNDVWVSSDGEGWRAALAEAPWPPRRGHAAVVFQDRIWLLGGSVGAESAADVWSSADGVTWRLELDSAPWGPRNEHAVVESGGRIWLLGGWSGTDRNDVWSSADGVTWERVTGAAPWSPRNGHAAVVHDGRLWLLGGWGRRGAGEEGDLADVWVSPDGVTWQRVTDRAPWPARNGHTALSAAGRLWVLGGWADGPGGEEGNVNDVWWTDDGAAWQLATGRAPWLPRNGHTSVHFAGRLWVIGGWSHFIGGTGVNDLWWSELE